MLRKKRLVIITFIVFIFSLSLFPQKTFAISCQTFTGLVKIQGRLVEDGKEIYLYYDEGDVHYVTTTQLHTTPTFNFSVDFYDPNDPRYKDGFPSENTSLCLKELGLCKSFGNTCYLKVDFEIGPTSTFSPGGSAGDSGSPGGSGGDSGVGSGESGYTPCPDGREGVQTALGCIPFEADALVKFFFRNLMGVVGGIGLLLMIYGSFLVLISGGDPEKVKKGKEIITSVVAGIIFIIFSLFLLRFIGIDILKIPGLK